MSPPGSLYAQPGSGAADWARGWAWLWRLGDVLSEPSSAAVGVGLAADAGHLAGLVADCTLAGAVVAVDAAVDGVPATHDVDGPCHLSGGTTVAGRFTVFGPGDDVAVDSNLGALAVRRDGVLYVGHDPAREWGDLSAFWVVEAVSDYLAEHADRPLTRLPAIGALRLDDFPTTAQLQLEGRAQSDEHQERRLSRTARRFERAGAVLNVAVVAAALRDGREVVPLHEVYPGSVRALRAGIEAGAYETVCHGYLHLDPEAFAAGEIEFREFGRLDAAEAGATLDRILAWQREHMSVATTFVAPAWTYGPAGDLEGAKRGLVRWYRARPGPLFEDERLYESLIGELPGIHRLDYSPLERLAVAGVPPMIAMHGALLDARLGPLRSIGGLPSLARLFVRRDADRLIKLDGIRWVGVSELVAALREHGSAAELS